MRLMGTENPNIFWDKEINIALTVRELQIIRDCIENNGYFEATLEYANMFNSEPPYNSKDMTNLYDQTQEILKEQGGYVLL